MKPLLLLLLLFILLSACENKQEENTSEPETATLEVKYSGALKQIMHEGDLSAKADLKDLKNLDHLYAIGALEGLKGEIQIIDGQSYVTYVDSTSHLAFDPSFEKRAAIIVYAQVENWMKFSIPAEVVTKDELENYIAQTAGENNINIHQPFPFMLDGNIAFIDWHVINWQDGDMEHTHEKHIQSGLHGTLIGEDARMIGFYSDAHHGVFTHHTTNMHIHVKTKDNMVAGHVDDLELGKVTTLLLPKI
ncbi:acetolactate decarboxylase [Parvicella tangerina]|uniref:Acetolactate decarboxylase n=1 Tax=Parvicella tangerina TaxID=2829795 RepID=A0A916NRR1_9FLAO|nr:acetolactate decarboxylase [Parvicella tangerina]CAG5081865.1 hypothetical protein CRYO30217_01748 [Parvicella tangerina]